MRNVRAIVMMTVSVAFASAAVFLAWHYLRAKAELDTSAIAVASKDIEIGARLSPESIQMVAWPRDSRPAGAFESLAPLLKDPGTEQPRVTRSGIQRGEPLLESRLAPVGSSGGMSAVITPGMRAITVRVNDVIGVAGFALPGSRVDVLVNTNAEQGSSNPNDSSISKTVLERILVLAAAQELSRDDAKPKVVNAVTLEVTPEDAERIDLARSVGTLSLVLRNAADVSTAPSRGITKPQLLGMIRIPPSAPVSVAREPRASAPAAVAPKHEHVEVIRGADRRPEATPNP